MGRTLSWAPSRKTQINCTSAQQRNPLVPIHHLRFVADQLLFVALPWLVPVHTAHGSCPFSWTNRRFDLIDSSNCEYEFLNAQKMNSSFTFSPMNGTEPQGTSSLRPFRKGKTFSNGCRIPFRRGKLANGIYCSGKLLFLLRNFFADSMDFWH